MASSQSRGALRRSSVTPSSTASLCRPGASWGGSWRTSVRPGTRLEATDYRCHRAGKGGKHAPVGIAEVGSYPQPEEAHDINGCAGGDADGEGAGRSISSSP